jgi:hypothetical protein
MLAALWPVYDYPVYPVRRPEEFSNARTRVYVEAKTMKGIEDEEHYIVIGHAVYKLPEAFEDGSLAWLGGFSSGLTELVYLGETWSDAQQRTNKRIRFFEEAGFDACAEAYREYAFPIRANPECEPLLAKLEKLGYPSELAGLRARNALAQMQASDALLNGHFEENSGNFYPPLLAYPGAWAAYIENCKQDPDDPPTWFYREFLDKLGFDRLAIERATP